MKGASHLNCMFSILGEVHAKLEMFVFNVPTLIPVDLLISQNESHR